MANQYTGSFEYVVQNKFQCDAQTLLEQAKRDQLSYNQVSELLGLKQVTVRKWANRFGIKLSHQQPSTAKQDQRQLFYAEKINEVNFLSRSWI